MRTAMQKIPVLRYRFPDNNLISNNISCMLQYADLSAQTATKNAAKLCKYCRNSHAAIPAQRAVSMRFARPKYAYETVHVAMSQNVQDPNMLKDRHIL